MSNEKENLPRPTDFQNVEVIVEVDTSLTPTPGVPLTGIGIALLTCALASLACCFFVPRPYVWIPVLTLSLSVGTLIAWGVVHGGSVK